MHAGTTVGPYQIVRQLGAGGMGVVWLAEDTRLHRKVALRTVKTADADTSEGRQRLMREARAAAALNHPHIAAVHDVLDIDDQVIVVLGVRRRRHADDATRLLGRVLMRVGQIEEGKARFQKALAIRPNSATVHSEMGLALYNASRFPEALEAFERAVALAPNSSVSLTQAGAASQAMGDNAGALAFYGRATAIQPRPETFSSMGTIYYSQGEYDKAARAYEAALLIRPLGAITHRNLGDAYRWLGRLDDARRAYREAVARAEAEVSVSPSDARAVARMAVYRAKAGDDAGARRSIEVAQTLAAGDEQVQLRVAVVHVLAGRTTPALDAIERAIAGGITPRAIAAEEDFARLRRLPRFAALVSNPAEVKR